MALVRHCVGSERASAYRRVAAHRAVQTARAFAAWQLDAVGRIGEALADYFAEEKRVLVRRPDFGAFAAEMADLRDAVERLAKRVERL